MRPAAPAAPAACLTIALASALLFACSTTDPSADDAPGADLPSPAQPAPDALVVSTTSGAVRGAIDGATSSWKGIPYAAPPVGDLRFRPPAPPAAWTDLRDGTAFGAPCMQIDVASQKPIGREDCLTLNVWSPSDGAGAPLPVLFWIHGGNNVIGASSEPYYEAASLAEKAHVVVVTINYRLGAFGWLAHPAFAAENPHASTGNYGLLDEIAALAWTKGNIAAFGGDPARVLVAGQSAGASNTCALLASPLARGLFSRAMTMSLACYVVDPAVVDSTNAVVTKTLGCTTGDVAACLRAKSASDVARLPGASLLRTNEVVSFYDVVDGWTLPDAPEYALAHVHHDVPMIVGTTKDEYSELLPLVVPLPPASADGYRVTLEQLFGAKNAPAIASAYPLEKYGSPYFALAALVGDQLMNCPSRRAARAASRSQTAPVYRYVFAAGRKTGPRAVYGAPHGIDASYLFRTFADGTSTPEESALADVLIGLVGRFAATGRPDGASWPSYDSSDPYLVVDTPLAQGKGWRNAECDFWETLPP